MKSIRVGSALDLSFLTQTRTPQVFRNREGRMEALLLFLLVAAAFLVRIWGISRAHFWDEMVYLQNAQVICCGKINYSELDFRPPLISLVYAGAFIAWRHIYAACIVAALLNSLGSLFLYRAGCLLVGRLPAAIAALLLAFSPFFVGVFPPGLDSDDTGNSLLTDSPALTLVLLALWFLLRALRRQSSLRFACAGLVLALSILMRFGTLPSVGMLLLLPVAAPQRWKALSACAIGLAIGLLPYLIWSRLRFGGFFSTLREGWTHVEGPTEPWFFYVRNAPAIFTAVALLGFLVAAFPCLSRLSASLAGFRSLARSRANFSPAQLQAFLWLWALTELVFFSAMPHKEPRYIMQIAPPLLLLAGSGLALLCALPHKSLQPAGALLVAVLMFFAFLPIRQRFEEPFINPAVPEELTASQFLETQIPSGSVLYMNFNYPAFAYYTSYFIHELPAVGPALYQDIERIPPGGILIVYRKTNEVWEPDVQWVNANPNFQRLRDFSTLAIYRRLAIAEK